MLKELQHNLGDDHTDAENMSNAVETYMAISVCNDGICAVVLVNEACSQSLPSPFIMFQARTQEVRKKKDAEHEMLTNPVQGFGGQVCDALFSLPTSLICKFCLSLSPKN